MKQKMNKMLKKLLLPLLAIVLLIPGQAFAAEYTCTVTIPVEVQVAGSDIPSGNEYQIILEALDESNPMPEENIVTITDSGKAQLGPITFTKPEDYQYKIYQSAESRMYFAYDTAVYTLTIRVVNDDTTGGLRAEIWATKDDDTEKIQNVVFQNSYYVPYNPPAGGDEPSDDAAEAAVEKPVEQIILPLLPQITGAAHVATGDNAQTMVFIMLALAAVIVIAAVMRRKQTNRINDQNE
ncbi:MAG: hypothetical protein IJ390_04545 [Lachnospiraceae bacterium]|nr:hypothetical protein [Lachnospiraceae bacterium]